MSDHSSHRPQQLSARLLALAAAFVILSALALTLSPAARGRSWEVSYRLDHWLGVALWLAAFGLAHDQVRRRLPDADPYLLPLAAWLSGWGLLEIWRLYPEFGLRQSLWLVVGAAVFVLALRLPADLRYLRRYKYLWLTGGLALTALTLIFGTNPSGAVSPRLWLGCCGVYFQPSEPLKLLLLVYLAAYLAGREAEQPARPAGGLRLLLLRLAPTLLMAGLALLLLVVQRDLGTASIFLFLYAVIVYVATGERRILLAGGLALAAAGTAGYALFDVVRLRVDAWLNPWIDPSGRSYQIVQSLMAVANGGLLGRGPGMGSPGLVPVPHSDFIYAAIGEEYGLAGTLALLALLALLAWRGVHIALGAADRYRRFLAAGLAAYLVGQSVLIIGGNLRLLPLTGVTLPFVSYGGTSLLVSLLSALFLLQISSRDEESPRPQVQARPYLELGAFLLCGLAAAALVNGWWAVFRADTLLSRTDNFRRALADQEVRRGGLLDRRGETLAESIGQPGQYTRWVSYPALGPVLGYTHPVYGQAGIESSLDSFLRGLEGTSSLSRFWNHLVYGQPPPGLDVRLTLDLNLQRQANQLLAGRRGALALLDAASGEILVLASAPGFDPNRLEQDWQSLVSDPTSPLLDRAALGSYPAGGAVGPFLLAQAISQSLPLESEPQRELYQEGHIRACALPPVDAGWGAALSSGCPGAAGALGAALGKASLLELFKTAGFYRAPELNLPTASLEAPAALDDAVLAGAGLLQLSPSPLQMALAAAALSGGGVRPPPLLASALNTPQTGWTMLAPLEQPLQIFDANAANEAARLLASGEEMTWQAVAVIPGEAGQGVTWFTGGTLPMWSGQRLALALVFEEIDPAGAQAAGQALLRAALNP